MSSLEFTEWIAFASVEPIGDEREDARFALLCKTLVDVNTDSKTSRQFKMADFLFRFWDEPEPQTEDEMMFNVSLLREALDSMEEEKDL